MSYTPQQGSVPWKVIEFFTTNPEEELTADDIGAKFDKPAKNVHSFLGPAVAAGVLKRIPAEEDGELVYRLGTGHPAIKPNEGSNPSLHSVSVWPDVAPAQQHMRAGKRLPALDLDAIKIEAGVPIAKGRTPAIDFMPLFNRMKPGESCVIHSAFKYVLGKACGEFKKAELGEMSIRKINDDELRLWKIK